MYINKFRKTNGKRIDNVIDYIHDIVDIDPNVTITVGCDSVQMRRRTTYCITIMMYDTLIRNGAHVIYFKESVKKIKDNNQRLGKEATYVYEVAEFLNKNLSDFYKRNDITEYEMKKYKYHLMKCSGKYSNLSKYDEERFINNISLLPSDIIDWKLVDIHVDFNPFTGITSEGGIKNKSYIAYKSYVPWLRGIGYRTWSKPESYCASSAADYLLK